MANENENEIKKEGEKAPQLKKKLNVVFRSQNSSTIKELPKSLKNATDNNTKTSSSQKTVQAGQKNGPRPLPAGTKPVKPAVFGNNEIKNQTVMPADAMPKLKKAEKPAPAPVQEAVQEQAKAETAPVKEETAKKETEVSKKETVKTEKKEKTVKETVSAAGGNHTEAVPAVPETAEAPKPNKTESKTAKTEHAEGKPETEKNAAAPAPEAPRIKIVKSYAGYDANAIIREASLAQKQKAMEEKKAMQSRRPQQGQGAKPQGDRTANGGAKGGRTFIARNPRAGEEGGQKQGGYQPRNSAPQGSRGPGARGPQGQAASQAQAFDSRNGKNAASKGRNAYSNKDKDRKDKYRDEIQQTTRKTGKGAFIKPELSKQDKPEDDIKVIVIPETLTIKDLSEKLHIQPSVIVKKLFLQGKMVTPNTELSYEEAEEIAMEYEILCEKEVPVDVIAELLKEGEEDTSKMVPRSPVVCVMGHVDHGKTSLLDAIRKTNVTSREAGGITQAIGASVVSINGKSITFLDTPGHEAFTAMRLRGAQSTDIAVLVVAADDGVKPQTIEAINHAKSAGVEVVVAINKIDKPAANIDRVKKELTEYELVAEEWGGSTPMVPVSAKTGEGIDDLLEMILLEADVLELKADPTRTARGIVIEAELDKGRGPVATVLVQKGTLRVGDNVAAGACYGKVRAMLDDKGNRVRKAGPSTPVEILGLNDVPNAGEVFMGCADEKEARNIADTFIAENKKAKLEETKQKMNLDDLFDEIQAGNIKELPIIIKADVQGSVEAVKQSLGKMSNEEVAVKVIHSGVGNINESDVSLASAANAIIIGFNVKPDPVAKSTAEHENVDVRLYKVIYQAIDDLEAALTGMLAPTYEEKMTGHLIVRQLFKASGVGTIAGCFVTDGAVERGSKARITRGEKEIFDGNIASLKRFKDEVKEVKTGFECGLVFEEFTDLQENDMVEVYKMVEVPRVPKKSND